MDHSKPEREKKADRVDVWLVKLAEKQICALEVLEESVHCMVEALLQGQVQEDDDLLKLAPGF